MKNEGNKERSRRVSEDGGNSIEVPHGDPQMEGKNIWDSKEELGDETERRRNVGFFKKKRVRKE